MLRKKITYKSLSPSSGFVLRSPLGGSNAPEHTGRVSTRLTASDRISGVLVRWDIGRNRYLVKSGLYACGSPDSASPVLVTANYKLTFDSVRKELGGQNLWILVLDTHGVNVWCASGKGTFGTKELVKRIQASGLSKIVSHRELILPQLGASGVAAHEVKKESGFTVRWGPVYAKDIPEYLGNGKTKTARMKRVEFKLSDRLAVAPVEIAHAWPLLFITVALSFLFSLSAKTAGASFFFSSLLSLTGGIFAGTVLFPVLMPFLPFRAFAAKGALLGLEWSVLSFAPFAHLSPGTLPVILLTVPLVSFLSMNFTGSSTFTCQKGAELEVKWSLPFMILSSASGILTGVLLWI